MENIFHGGEVHNGEIQLLMVRVIYNKKGWRKK